MIFIYFLLSVIITFSFIFFIIIYFYNKFQSNIIRINEAEANIDNYLRKKFDYLNRVINIINANSNIKENFFEEIIKLRSRKLTNFELDRKLADGLDTFIIVKDKYSELKNSNAFTKICLSIDEVEESLDACKNYYNDNIISYNKLIRSFPSNIIGKFLNYSEKNFFDGKDMNDEIYDDFKL